jgi:hypothetical protein
MLLTCGKLGEQSVLLGSNQSNSVSAAYAADELRLERAPPFTSPCGHVCTLHVEQPNAIKVA